MKKSHALLPAKAESLQQQVFDEEHPGALLHDFQVVLDRIGTEGVEAAGKHNLLPMALIEELDQRLKRPLNIMKALKRPQLRSHPYLQGLHLLLRASTLVQVKGGGTKARLVVDPVMLESWDRLNPTERYFNLLEAWLRFGKPEMVGERGSPVDSTVLTALQLRKYIPDNGVQYDLKKPLEVYLGRIGREFYVVALADLFGLVKVDHPSAPVQPWTPAGLAPLPFGDAIFAVLAKEFDRKGFDAIDQWEQTESFGVWQKLFQPLFPDWKKNLQLPRPEDKSGVYVFRVSLGKAWRLIAIPSDCTLSDLVDCLLQEIDFDDDHLHEFIYKDRHGRLQRVLHPAMEEGPHTNRVRIGEMPLEPGQSMRLVYDFGDNWRFDVRLERIEEGDSRKKKPSVLERQGKAPKQYPDSDW